MTLKKNPVSCFLVLLSAVALCSCARPAPPTESYGAAAPTELSSAAQEETAASPQEEQARFDEFTDRVFREALSEDPLSLHFSLCQPESFGISGVEMKFPAISQEELLEGARENDQLQEELSSFDASVLTADQLFTYKMIQDQLDTEKLSQGLELYYQPLSPVTGIQADLPVLLAEYQFYDRQDVEDYLALLSDIDRYYGQIAEFEKERAEAGLAPSDATIDRLIQSCKDYLIRPENSFLSETFSSRLEDVEGLSQEEKEEYCQRHLTILKEHFIPAYTQLSEAMEGLKGQGTNDKGLCYFEDGKKYYEYLAASLTGSDSSIPELKDRITKQFGSDMADISLLLQKNQDLERLASGAAFSPSEPLDILNHLQKQIETDFPALNDTSFEVKYVPKALESTLSPAFYLVPPLDAENTNIIYINGKSSGSQNLYTTLAHEGYPGHLYQSVNFNRRGSCPLRRLLQCGGYVEGWGMYCELYSYSFDNGLPDEVKRLLQCNDSATYALYALLDIHINYDGWDREKTSGFLNDYFGISDSEVVEEMYQTMIDDPGNYLKYYIGNLEILTMREKAQEALGSRYDAKSFHKFIMDMDGASFRVIKPYFDAWLLSYGMNTP